MKAKIGDFFKRMLAGVVIGIGGILPGVSGGILAVSMGIYESVISAICHFFRRFKENFFFLLPIVIGGAIGILGTSHLVEWLLANFYLPVMYLFIGFVAGGIPALIKKGNGVDKFQKKYILAFVIGVAINLSFSLLDRGVTGAEALPLNIWTAMLCGVFLALGTVIPGVSTSFILIFLGLYEPLLATFNRFVRTMISWILGHGGNLWGDFVIMFFMGIGLLASAALLILFVKRMFERHRGVAYYGVLGFLIASIIMIFPGFALNWLQLISVVLLAGGFVTSMIVERAMTK